MLKERIPLLISAFWLWVYCVLPLRAQSHMLSHICTSRMGCLCLWELELIHQDSVIKYYKELEALLTPSSPDAFLPCELFKVLCELPWGLCKRNSQSPSNMLWPALSSKPAFSKHLNSGSISPPLGGEWSPTVKIFRSLCS